MRDQENLRERRKQNYQKTKANVLEENRQYALRTRDKIIARKKKYYSENKDKVKVRSAKYYLKHKEHINKRCKIYIKQYLTTPHWKLVWNTMRQKRHARKVSTEDWTVTKQFIEWLFIVQDYKCKICNCDITIKYHIDHIYPLSKWGKHISINIQLLCPLCNLQKHDKVS